MPRTELFTRFRQAQVLLAQDRDAAALPILEQLVRERSRTPPTFLAEAGVDAARIHARAGNIARARELYESASGVFGADERVKAVAEREAAGLTSR